MSLRPGKLPASLLAELLRGIPSHPRVIVGPGIGRDAAVIDMGGGRVLVAKTDPITFATELAGWYAVNVNANDIACMGAEPAWLLATALLPEGEREALAAEIFEQLEDACGKLGVALVGGHTEVTIGVDRPIIVGAMLGEALRDDIVSGEAIEEGDAVLLTKGIAIEGTSLLARESGDALARRGVDGDTITRAAAMLFEPGISVVEDARAIRRATRPRLMHDPTEGGLATALYELAAVAACTIRVDVSAVPVFEETHAICGALELDPLGLLSSGALLAIIPRQHVAAVTSELARIKIDGRIIGAVESGEARVIMGAEDPASPLPTFDRDELARFYGGAVTRGERPPRKD
jgi:hydrogenase maturation factor